MIKITPVQRISFAIVMLTVSLLVFSDLIGLMPNKHNNALELRKQVAEALTIQLSQLAAAGNFHILETTLHAIVSRNEDILSAALRRSNGQSVSEYGDHKLHWGSHHEEKSTLTHVRVPIIQGGRQWGLVEIRFTDLYTGDVANYLHHSLIGLIGFVAIFGFLSYILFLRRALRALDPSSVIPDRVRSAFDLMAEGIAILDEKGQVVLANTSLSQRLNTEPDDLMGKDLSKLNWRTRDDELPFPWDTSRLNKSRQMGIPVILGVPGSSEGYTIFTVNSAPILDTKGVSRGVFITFDDMTVLEKKNDELSSALTLLTESKAEIVRQNEELHFLATRDPMTNAFNRRALFEHFHQIFAAAKQSQQPVSAVMVDIDHFKSVNDTYGHAVGDEVIKQVAKILQEESREVDVVGRYGGEEFVMALPDTTLNEAEQLAERIRRNILESSQSDNFPVQRLTASLGVATLGEDIDSPDALIDLADQALYQAKTSGRNRVIRSDQLRKDGAPANENQCTEAAERTSLQVKLEKLKRLAAERKLALEQGLMYDAETGLPNRNLLKDRIEEAVARQLRVGGYGAVVSLYVKAYEKAVNAYGYDAAGQFISSIVVELQAHLRTTDTVARSNDGTIDTPDFYRVGSAEIGVLLVDLDTKASVIKVLVRLEELLAKPVEVNDTSFLPNAVMGVALYPMDGNEAESLLRNASAARTFAEESATQYHFSFYSGHMNDLAREQLLIEAELQQALINQEFELWYQPKVSEYPTSRVTGLEALLRWRHPERGIIYPDKFIQIAEQSDLIKHIGLWVVDTALQQLEQWKNTDLASMRIAVNVSPRQFQDGKFAEHLEGIAGATPDLLRKLDLELTEGLLMQDQENVRSIMERFAGYGINLVLDDFGTGYSSLSYIKNLPIHALKIDRSFMQDIVTSDQEQAIVRSIVQVANGLNLGLVAEGVETAEQLEIMVKLGCDEFQGFYFSRAIPENEIVELIRQTHTSTSDSFPMKLTAK